MGRSRSAQYDWMRPTLANFHQRLKSHPAARLNAHGYMLRQQIAAAAAQREYGGNVGSVSLLVDRQSNAMPVKRFCGLHTVGVVKRDVFSGALPCKRAHEIDRILDNVLPVAKTLLPICLIAGIQYAGYGGLNQSATHICRVLIEPPTEFGWQVH